MNSQQQRKHELESRAYMANTTDRQLEYIVADEKRRKRRGGDVGEVAAIMLRAAECEFYRRNGYFPR